MVQPEKITMQDIAARCGVSASTVSRVLNGSSQISEATKRAVLNAATELGYVPDIFARSLRSDAQRIAGIFVNSVSPAFETSSRLLSILINLLTEKGFTPFVCITGIDAEKELYYYQRLEAVHASVIFKILNNSNHKLDEISSIPIIYLYNYPLQDTPGEHVYRVETDNYGAGYQAGQELLRQGCRVISEVRLISPRAGFPFARHLGLLQALYDHGAVYDELRSVICNQNDFGSILQSIDDHLAQISPADGYFCSSDLAAMALQASLEAHGFTIPGQVKIIGCNNMSISQCSIRPVSTVSHRWDDLCEAAISLMDKIMFGEPFSPEDRRIIIPTDLVPRATTL